MQIIKITPIYKSRNRTLPENYRPISTINNFAKIIDNILYNQLTQYIETNNLISNNQYGFRRKHSCTLQLIRVKDKILKNLENNMFTIVIFIDIKQAFPLIDHQIIRIKLKKIGCSDKVINLLNSYLTNMKHYTCINHQQSEMVNFKAGVNQGLKLAILALLSHTYSGGCDHLLSHPVGGPHVVIA